MLQVLPHHKVSSRFNSPEQGKRPIMSHCSAPGPVGSGRRSSQRHRFRGFRVWGSEHTQAAAAPHALTSRGSGGSGSCMTSMCRARWSRSARADTSADATAAKAPRSMSRPTKARSCSLPAASGSTPLQTGSHHSYLRTGQL